jgi:nucleoside-diphosphate-sugar epimerase
MKKIFITGASGCVGHYVLEEFLKKKDYELHLLVRTPQKIKINLESHPQIKLHTGSLEKIQEYKELLKDMDFLIHIATSWENSDLAYKINVEKTFELFEYAQNCQKIIYFSTASILGKNNKVKPEAESAGTAYVRTKYLAYKKLGETKNLAAKTITLFPTLLFGGDNYRPLSHISSGIRPNVKFLKLLRFIYMDSTMHFIHAADIAQAVKYLVENNVKEKEFVLGNQVMCAKEIIKRLCAFFKIRVYFQIKIKPGFIFFLTKIFRKEIEPWDKHCIKNPYFEYKTVTPASFGLKPKYPTLESILQDL